MKVTLDLPDALVRDISAQISDVCDFDAEVNQLLTESLKARTKLIVLELEEIERLVKSMHTQFILQAPGTRMLVSEIYELTVEGSVWNNVHPSTRKSIGKRFAAFVVDHAGAELTDMVVRQANKNQQGASFYLTTQKD